VIESGGSDEFGIPPYSAPAPPTDVAPVAVLPPAPADEYAGAAALPPAPTPLPQLFDCFEYKDKKSCEMKFTSGGLETNPTRKKIKLVSENGLSLAVDLVMSEGEVYILQIHFDGEDFVVDEKSIKYEKDGSELSFTALEVDEQNGILAHIFGVLAQNQKFFQPYSLQFARAATLPLPPAALPPAPAEEYADGAALPPPPPAALPPAPAGEYADGAALPPPPPAALPLAPAGAYADGAALPSPPVAPVARPVAEVPAFINPDMIERAAANTSGSFTNEYDNSDSGSESEWAVVGNPDDYSARSGILVNPVNHSAV
jgi:hypothetical protein